jgi:reactive intermediate/imine deaminase
MRQAITTISAPAAIGAYSQAVKAGNTIYLSGQIGLEPASQQMVEGMAAQVTQVFENMQAVIKASGGTMDDVVKLTVYLVKLADITLVNETIAKYFKEPFPARTTIEVSALPKAGVVEVEAIVVLKSPAP